MTGHVTGEDVPGRVTAPARPGHGESARDRGRTDTERGMVLLETAIAIPALVAVAAALAWCLSLASTAVSLSDAARAAARDIARGVAVSEALARASSMVPGGEVVVSGDGPMVVVVARRQVSVPFPLLRGLSVPLEQSVAMAREWQ